MAVEEGRKVSGAWRSANRDLSLARVDLVAKGASRQEDCSDIGPDLENWSRFLHFCPNAPTAEKQEGSDIPIGHTRFKLLPVFLEEDYGGSGQVQ